MSNHCRLLVALPEDRGWIFCAPGFFLEFYCPLSLIRDVSYGLMIYSDF